MERILKVEDVRDELDTLFFGLNELYNDLYDEYHELWRVLNNIDKNRSNNIYTREKNRSALMALCTNYIPELILEEYSLITENVEITTLIPDYLKQFIGINENDLEHIEDYSYVDAFIFDRFYPIQKKINYSRMISASSYAVRLLETELFLTKYILDTTDELPGQFRIFEGEVIGKIKPEMTDLYVFRQASFIKKSEKRENIEINNKLITDLMFTNHYFEDKMLDVFAGEIIDPEVLFKNLPYNYNNSSKEDTEEYKKRVLNCIKAVEKYNAFESTYTGKNSKYSPVKLSKEYFEKLMLSYLKTQYTFMDNKSLTEMGNFLNRLSNSKLPAVKFGSGISITKRTVEDFYNKQVKEVKNERRRNKK